MSRILITVMGLVVLHSCTRKHHLDKVLPANLDSISIYYYPYQFLNPSFDLGPSSEKKCYIARTKEEVEFMKNQTYRIGRQRLSRTRRISYPDLIIAKGDFKYIDERHKMVWSTDNGLIREHIPLMQSHAKTVKKSELNSLCDSLRNLGIPFYVNRDTTNSTGIQRFHIEGYLPKELVDLPAIKKTKQKYDTQVYKIASQIGDALEMNFNKNVWMLDLQVLGDLVHVTLDISTAYQLEEVNISNPGFQSLRLKSIKSGNYTEPAFHVSYFLK